MVCFCGCVSNWVYSSKTHQYPKRNEPFQKQIKILWVWVQFSQVLLGPSQFEKYSCQHCEKPRFVGHSPGVLKNNGWSQQLYQWNLHQAETSSCWPRPWDAQILGFPNSCWWFRNPARKPPSTCIKPVVNSGINYRCRIFFHQRYVSYTILDVTYHTDVWWFIQHERLNFYESVSNSALEFIYLNPPVGCLNRPARAEIWWSTGCLGAFFWVDPTHYSWSVPPTALLVPVVSGCFQIANMTDWKMMKRCKANVNEHEVVKRWNIKIYI